MKTFKIKNEIGVEIEYYVVGEKEENNKKYIIYTDFVKDKKTNNLRLLAGEEKDGKLLKISTSLEKELIDEFLKEIEKFQKQSQKIKSRYKDLSFTRINEQGIETINDILKIIPNEKNNEEPYIIFTDYMLDEDDEFINHYGKLICTNNSYSIETNITTEEEIYIEKMLEDEIVQYVNKALEESLYEE